MPGSGWPLAPCPLCRPPPGVAPLTPFSRRPWAGFHRLPQSRDADALVPALGHALLLHAPRAGAGQPGAAAGRGTGTGRGRGGTSPLSPALCHSLSAWRVSSRASWTCSPSRGLARCAVSSPLRSAASSAASSTSPWSRRWGTRQGHRPAGPTLGTCGCPPGRHLPRGPSVGWELPGAAAPTAAGRGGGARGVGVPVAVEVPVAWGCPWPRQVPVVVGTLRQHRVPMACRVSVPGGAPVLARLRPCRCGGTRASAGQLAQPR